MGEPATYSFGLAIHEAATRGVYSFLEKYTPLPATYSFGLAIHEAATRGVYSFLEKYIPLPASFSFWSGPT